MSVINEIKSSVFRINTYAGSGTGFFSKKEKIVITNYHVVAGNHTVSVEDIDRNRYLANVIYVNPGEDIAFLDAGNLPEPSRTVEMEHEGEPSSGSKVLVLGFPYGMPFTVTEGIVSNPRQIMDGKQYIQTDAAVNPGNSGGPMINQKGQLIGIVTSKFSEADNIGFGIPAQTFCKELEIIHEIQRDGFTLGCPNCGGLIKEKTSFCPNCGGDIDGRIFEHSPLSDLSVKVESAISKLDINPILARAGREYWMFHQGSAEVSIFVFDNNYLFVDAPLVELPRKGLDRLCEYILTENIEKYRLSVYDNRVHLSYRIHISDLYSDNEKHVLDDIAQLAPRADELDDLLINEYGASKTHHSKT